MVKDKDKWNAYKRQYYATHPEARKHRDAYTAKWREENKEKWNEYQREYQRQRRMKKAKEKLKEDGIL